MNSIHERLIEEVGKGSKKADSKPEQELKRTVAQLLPTVSNPHQPHSYLSPTRSSLRPHTGLLPSSFPTLPRSPHRSVDNWRQMEGKTSVKSAAAGGARENDKAAVSGGRKSASLNGMLRSSSLSSPPASSQSMADGGQLQSQHPRSSQDVRQLLPDMRTLPFIPLDPVLSAIAVDDHKSGGCSVQTLHSPVLAAKRGESRTSIGLSQATSPEARRVLLSASQDRAEEAKAAGKTGLYKTEMCRNWEAVGRCSYGNKCRFAHGKQDVKDRPCTDLARDGSRTCTYGKRCNYAHPGDSIRRVSTGVKLAASKDRSSAQPVGELVDGGYMDAQYIAWTKVKYPTHKHPFGMFI